MMAVEDADGAPTASTAVPDILRAAEAFVRAEVACHDASHDFSHIDRVRRNALAIAAAEGVVDPHPLFIIQLASLLHDVGDWKYSKDEGAAAAAIGQWLGEQGVSAADAARVLAIVASVGFKEELAGGCRSGDGGVLDLQAAIVQDADRLDAIGAIGIARCFTFGGRFARVLHDPAAPPRTALTKEAYMSGGHNATTVNHFYEKLLLLKDKMKTGAGRRLAEGRHQTMLRYLEAFHREWDGQA